VPGPLDGFKIIDISRAGVGQMATGILADYGADVISIVETGYTERLGSQLSGQGRANRRNKRSIFLNLKVDEGREIFFKLAQRCDAMLESNRPGVVERLGVDYGSVKRINPSIVYCALSGYGQTSPYRDIPGHDISYQGVGGMLPLDESDNPHIPPYNQADLNAAWNAAVALLIGLLYRSRTGAGQYIDVALSDCAVTIPPGRVRLKVLRGHYPCYNLYQTKDGKYITLSILETQFWEHLCKLINREDWIPHQYPEGQLKEEMFEFFRVNFGTKTQQEWFKILRENDIQSGPVNRTIEEVVSDPHNRARDMILEAVNPRTGQRIYQPGFTLKFSQTPAALRCAPTMMGSETVEILKELDYSQSEISSLRDRGVIE